MKIITVTLSPAYDIHCKTDVLIAGRENTVALTSYDAGGKGINLSRALAAMGKESTAVLALGEDNPDVFIASMTESEIDYKAIKIPGRIRENITVHTESGAETRISFKAESYTVGTLERAERIISDSIDGDTAVVFAGKLPEGIKEHGFCRILASIKEKGAKIVLDSRSLTASDIAQIKPFLIKPNLEELEELLGCKLRDSEDVKSASERICALGADSVLVSLGDKGALLFGALGEYFVEAPRINAVSTVGAGDSMLAGFLYAYSKGLCASECLKMAVASGSAACLTEGTASPDLCAIQNILGNMQ